MNTKRICKILVAALAATLVLACAAGFSACGEETGGSDLEARMGELEAKLVESEKKVGELETKIEESEKKVGELETNLEETASELDDAKAKIDELESGDGTSSENPSAQSSSGDFLYTAFYDGSGYMVAWIGDWYGAELVIPSEHNGLPVVAIGYEAFSVGGYNFSDVIGSNNSDDYGYPFIESIVIPDSVEYIGEYAFAGCSSVKSVVIGKGLKSMGLYAFERCSSMEAIYYAGTEDDFNEIAGIDKSWYEEGTIYFYSETAPADEGNFWHYVDGAATVWGE